MGGEITTQADEIQKGNIGPKPVPIFASAGFEMYSYNVTEPVDVETIEVGVPNKDFKGLGCRSKSKVYPKTPHYYEGCAFEKTKNNRKRNSGGRAVTCKEYMEETCIPSVLDQYTKSEIGLRNREILTDAWCKTYFL